MVTIKSNTKYNTNFRTNNNKNFSSAPLDLSMALVSDNQVKVTNNSERSVRPKQGNMYTPCIPVIPDKQRNQSELDSSTTSSTFNDSLYTICDTPNSAITVIRTDIENSLPCGQISKYDISNSHNGSNSISTESFLELPTVLNPSPTYHIRQDPHTIQIRNTLTPLGTKRKGIGEKEGEKIEPTLKSKNSPSPKRNRTLL